MTINPFTESGSSQVSFCFTGERIMSTHLQKTLVGLIAAAGIALTSANAQAAVLYSNAGSGVLSDGLTTSIGTRFTAVTSFTITQLGFFDDDGDGNAVAHGVGLFSDDGSVLHRSVSIQAGLASPLLGQFRYEFITPFTLVAGTTYRLGGAIFTNSGDRYRDVTASYTLGGFNVDIIDGIYQIAQTPGLAYPESQAAVTDGAYIGPTFGDAIPVPEPGSIALLFTAIIGLMRVARRRQE
jgi:hypothetical protein